MRENNIYWKNYCSELDSAGLSPADQMGDIFVLLTAEEKPFYTDFRKHLQILDQAYRTGDTIQQGRKKLSAHDYWCEVVCEPVYEMTRIEREYPLKNEDMGDGRFYVFREVPDKVREELKFLHWLYIELEIIGMRVRDGIKYAWD